MFGGIVKAPERDEVAVPPAYAFFQLNSKDRNTATGAIRSNPITGDVGQPWNDFRIQKPAPLLEAFANRLGVVEVAIPWAIPNITDYNNSFVVFDTEASATFTITIPSGFYSGSALATAVNLACANAMTPTAPPIFTWNDTNKTMSVIPGVGTTIMLIPSNELPAVFNAKWFSEPNLLKTMGFSYNQIQYSFTRPQTLIGMPTRLLYTSYIDITSEKLHYNNEVSDGTSDNDKNVNAVLCRVFCSDETSGSDSYTTGQAPFMIHRQFKNPKMIKWNEHAFIDWFKIQIYDEYGNLVWLPPGVVNGTPSPQFYPDFQLVFLATED